MTDEENLKLIEQVHKLLDQSDYDYVLLATRRLDNQNVDGNIGLRTGDGFESAAHLLLEQSMSEKGEAAVAFIHALAEEALASRLRNIPMPASGNIMCN